MALESVPGEESAGSMAPPHFPEEEEGFQVCSSNGETQKQTTYYWSYSMDQGLSNNTNACIVTYF